MSDMAVFRWSHCDCLGDGAPTKLVILGFSTHASGSSTGPIRNRQKLEGFIADSRHTAQFMTTALYRGSIPYTIQDDIDLEGRPTYRIICNLASSGYVWVRSDRPKPKPEKFFVITHCSFFICFPHTDIVSNSPFTASESTRSLSLGWTSVLPQVVKG